MSTPSITCPKCKRTSYHPKDIAEGYCGWCHEWTSTPPDATLPRNQLGKRIAPGIWEDKEGTIHWSLTELMSLFELEDTPENRVRVTDILKRVMLETNPQATIIEREKPD